MTIIEVKPGEKKWKLFLRVPHLIYRHNPHWICPFDSEVTGIFDPSQNKAFEEGQAACFVLLEDNGSPIGRIAAFVDEQRNRVRGERVGGIGFFECIENKEGAFMLFERAESFLNGFDVNFVDGPVNFGERDKYWGLLSNYHDQAPLYQENYHPAYYYPYFTEWGFEPFEQILTMKGLVADINFDRLQKIAERLKQRSPVRVENFDFGQIDRYAKDFSIAYNGSFGHYEHFKPVTEGQVRKLMKEARMVADPALVSVAYYDDLPVGFAAIFPDINPLVKVTNGKLNWRTIPAFLLKKAFKRRYDLKGMGFGVNPEYQSKGIYSLLIDKMGREMNREKYRHLYLATVRAHNTVAVSVYRKLSTEPERIHHTMRKAMKPGLRVEPFEFLDSAKETSEVL